ncbi:hypothetical protein ACQJBY_072175 [Aegilops geniculata]
MVHGGRWIWGGGPSGEGGACLAVVGGRQHTEAHPWSRGRRGGGGRGGRCESRLHRFTRSEEGGFSARGPSSPIRSGLRRPLVRRACRRGGVLRVEGADSGKPLAGGDGHNVDGAAGAFSLLRATPRSTRNKTKGRCTWLVDVELARFGLVVASLCAAGSENIK